jgi:predicted metal-dependent hydrolase
MKAGPELLQAPDLTDAPQVLPPGCSWHTLTLGPQSLGYVLRRSRRRSIGLIVRDTGLLIQAPTWASRQQIEAAIQQKSSWIRDKLQARTRRLELLALQARQWRDGGSMSYLGVAIGLRLAGSGEARYSGTPETPQVGDNLLLPLPASAEAVHIQAHAQAWLQARALIDFERRLRHYLNLSGQWIQGWGLSTARGRWGSCTSQRRIRLNWRLIHLEPALIDYVVAHEVAHLRHMNHSPAFWQVVEQLCPDFRQARSRLTQHSPESLPLPGPGSWPGPGPQSAVPAPSSPAFAYDKG